MLREDEVVDITMIHQWHNDLPEALSVAFYQYLPGSSRNGHGAIFYSQRYIATVFDWPLETMGRTESWLDLQ